MNINDFILAGKLAGSGGGGGGGSSDFSTAKITIINNSGVSVGCTLIVAKYSEWNDTYMSYVVTFLENDNTPVEYDLILYKGNSQVYIDDVDPENLTLSGSIISDEDGGYYAQGDCSITISA